VGDDVRLDQVLEKTLLHWNASLSRIPLR
jgi:hypothetical protein